ncbi:hypothetical protein Chor_004428 [Crotalus horridus]
MKSVFVTVGTTSFDDLIAAVTSPEATQARAGSCLEVLEAGKPLLVVINDQLMDNHQLELARQLHKDGHLFYCTCKTLVEMLRSMDLSTLKPFLPGQPEKFAAFLDNVIGS